MTKFTEYSMWRPGSELGEAQEKFGVSELGLSVRAHKGSVYLVDSDGKILKGVTSVTVTSSIDDLTRLNIDAFSFSQFDEGHE